MPQPPILVDEVQIEPGTTTYGSRVIGRDTTDGGLQFIDPNVTAALKNLVGLRNITGLFIVGRAGDGAPYTTIQSALDAVSDATTSAAPALVWVLPGVYTENVTIEKDGVVLASAGGAKIINSGGSDTVTVAASIAAIPLYTVIQNLIIENDQVAQACVRINGANQFASGTVTVINAPLSVGDTLTISGTALTGVASTRTSGSDDFSVSGGTPSAIAAEITAAINDSANSFDTLVEATVAAEVVTLTAVTAGSGGNALTLASSTTPVGGLTLSGATLAGGGADGSTLASESCSILDCELIASTAGGYQINADVANFIRVRGGTFRGSSTISTCLIAECASFRVWGVEWANDFNLGYDTANDEPSAGTSAYEIKGCGRANDFTVDLDGLGSLTIDGIPTVGDITMGGDQTLSCKGCGLGDIALNETIAATLSRCKRGSLTLTGGTPTLAESVSIGTATFAVSSSESVAFIIDQPDTTYYVLLENPQTAETLGISAKLVGGFDIDSSGAMTGTVGYTVMRDV